jgi:hypothetical protein
MLGGDVRGARGGVYLWLMAGYIYSVFHDNKDLKTRYRQARLSTRTITFILFLAPYE